MMVDVKLADGRTTFRFWSRGQFVACLKRNVTEINTPDHRKSSPIACFARWHTEQEGWEPARITYIRPNSVAFVRAVFREEREAFEQEYGARPAQSPPTAPPRASLDSGRSATPPTARVADTE